jgi:regulator of protease activity HflC (stomatin/prohibitin superfamily)
MRTFLEVLLILVLAGLSIWAGLPWPIVFVVASLLACGLRLFSFTKSDSVDPGLFFALAGFLGVWFLISWAADYRVSPPGEGGPGPITSSGLLAANVWRVAWPLFLGLSLTVTFCLLLLLPVSFIAARMVYGVYDQYKGHELAAMRSLIRSVLGIAEGTLLVKGGTVQIVDRQGESLSLFGGPGKLIVLEGHAVILEKAGFLSRIEGMGITQLAKFERVGVVVDLTEKSQALEGENVVTQEGVILGKVQAVIFYQVIPGDHENGRFPYSEGVVYRFWNAKGEQTWQNSVQSIAKSALRDVVAKFTLTDIFGSPDEFRRRVKVDLRESINSVTEPLLGVRITSADIGEIQLPAEAEQKLLQQWLAGRDVEIARSQGDKELAQAQGRQRTTELDAQSTVEQARAQAEAAMIKGRANAEALAEHYRRLSINLESAVPRETIAEILKNLRVESEEESRR